MKLKNLLKGIAIGLAIVLTVGLAVSLIRWETIFPTPTPETYDYSIRYVRADTGEDILESYGFMLKSKGNYPSGYNADTAMFTISPLLGEMKPIPEEWEMGGYVGAEVSDPKDSQKTYAFYGWYLDEECTLPFGGTVYKGRASSLVLYAKIETSYWTGFY